MTLTIYTDGACEPNPGKGGWAFVAYSNGKSMPAHKPISRRPSPKETAA